MEVPTGLTALCDADVLKYEIGYAAEVGWEAKRQDGSKPPFDYAENVLLKRIDEICRATKAADYKLYLSGTRSFRYDIAKRRPYKAKRTGDKPFHFKNLHVYMRDVLGAQVSEDGREADDDMAIAHTASEGKTIIASRDKDMKQIGGWSFSWELNLQPQWGPELITKEGYLTLSGNRKKLSGTGLSFFYAQCLIGDVVDNIPGCPGVGPVAAYELLAGKPPEEQLEAVSEAYRVAYHTIRMEGPEWVEQLEEQGQLAWLQRYPGQQWKIGTIE